MGPNARISATSTAPVARVFASSADRYVAAGQALAHDAGPDYGSQQECRAKSFSYSTPGHNTPWEPVSRRE